uniref:Uncharacterized protein n=1 Tax=Daphnia galeata TaxID=27404 RepID=A0A8J2RCS8_9CRUS|nr:unnamed protein product [Daphnia galeata]
MPSNYAHHRYIFHADEEEQFSLQLYLPAMQSKVLKTRFLRGCAFHWTQSLFRNLKKIGLVPVCRSNPRVQLLCKRAMSLHLLPPTKIVKLFPKLKNKAAKLKIVLLDKFFTYIENTWLQPESEFVQVEEAYLKQNQTTRHTQLGQKVLQHQLFVLWEDYDRDKTDTYRLLQKLTRLSHRRRGRGIIKKLFIILIFNRFLRDRTREGGMKLRHDDHYANCDGVLLQR